MGGGLSRSSVASFLLLWGGGGKTPKCTDRKKKSCICNLYARASEASERLRNICIFRSQNTSACTTSLVVYDFIYIQSHIQPMQWYGIINDSMTDKTLTLRKSINMRASGVSELRKFLHLLILKLLFPSIFCWYFRYFVSETYIFSGLQLHLHTYLYN